MTVAAATCGALMYQHHRELEATRARGIRLLHDAQYRDATRALAQYLRSHPDDALVVAAFGRARPRVPAPGAAEHELTFAAWRDLVANPPAPPEALRQASDWALRAGQPAAALAYAKRLAAGYDQEPEHHYRLAAAQVRTGKTVEALDTLARLLQRWPYYFKARLLQVDLMYRRQVPQPEILAAIERPGDAHADPAGSLLRAYLYRAAGQHEEALRALEPLEELPPQSADYDLLLVDLLERYGQYAAAREILIAAAEKSPSPRLLQPLIWRLYTLGDFESLRSHLDAWQKGRPLEQYMHVIATLSHLLQNDREAALARVETMPEDAANETQWRILLRDLVAGDRNQEAGSRALDHAARLGHGQPHNPLIQQVWAMAAMQVRETEIAVAALQRAALVAMPWPWVHLELARLEYQLGHYPEAAVSALTAMRQAPASLRAVRLLVSAGVSEIESRPESLSAGAARVGAVLEMVRRQMPADPGWTMWQMRLDVARGRMDDAAALAEAIDAQTVDPGDAAVLADLARRGLNLPRPLTARIEALTPRMPARVLQVASAEARSGDVAAGLEQIERAMANAPADDQDGWEMALVHYLEQYDPAAAAQYWQELLKQPDAHLALLHRAARSPALPHNPALARSVVVKLREITGQSGVSWKLAESRRLLHAAQNVGEQADASDAAGSEAAAALRLLDQVVAAVPRMISARVLRAGTLRRVGRLEDAVAELKRAVEDEAAGSPSLQLQLAIWLEEAGDGQGAAEAAAQFARSTDGADTSQIEAAAGVLLRHGRAEEAAKLLAARDDALDMKLLEAQLAAGDRVAATDSIAALLQRRSHKPQDLVALCLWARQLGDEQLAARAAARVDAAALPLADRLMLSMMQGTPIAGAGVDGASDESAGKALETADATVRLLATQLQRGLLAEAARYAREAMVQGADDPAIQRVAEHAEVLSSMRPEDPAGILTVELLDPTRGPIVAAILKNLPPISAAKERNAYLAAQAVDHPRILAVHLASIGSMAVAGATERATQEMRRVADLFPADPRPARLAAELSLSLGDTEGALGDAAKWREASGIWTWPADRFTARALLASGDAHRAVEVLEPYVTGDLREVSGDAGRILLAEALAMTGQPQRAHALIFPISSERRDAVVVAMRLAAEELTALDSSSWLASLESSPPVQGDASLHLDLGCAWIAAGRRHEDADMVQRGAAMVRTHLDQPDPPVRALLQMAMLADIAGAADDAVTYYRRALARQPDHAVACNNLALLLIRRQGAAAEALTLAKRAVKAMPLVSSVHDTLARVHAVMGQWHEAAATWRQALALDPKSIDMTLALIHAELQAGRITEARQMLAGMLSRQINMEQQQELDRLTQMAAADAS